jgi:diketogulonate reductase-like aldo/keto reductase
MERRHFLKLLPPGLVWAAGGSALLAGGTGTSVQLTRKIPSTGELLPVIGMGTWLTFNVPVRGPLIKERKAVLRAFFANGGGMIDSSPMYGNAEAAVGACLRDLRRADGLFSATKVWAAGDRQGVEQHETSLGLWGLDRLDLQQVHNLVNWESHLKMLRERKAAGQVRYIGVTTSHGRRHRELASIMRNEPLDFVQLTYNILNRKTEPLLELARERGIGVIVNRPFEGGRLIDSMQRNELPEWVRELGIRHWPHFLLRWIVSHPAVTCAIPATTQVAHMHENMAAGRGRFLSFEERARLEAFVAAI